VGRPDSADFNLTPDDRAFVIPPADILSFCKPGPFSSTVLTKLCFFRAHNAHHSRGLHFPFSRSTPLCTFYSLLPKRLFSDGLIMVLSLFLDAAATSSSGLSASLFLAFFHERFRFS